MKYYLKKHELSQNMAAQANKISLKKSKFAVINGLI